MNMNTIRLAAIFAKHPRQALRRRKAFARPWAKTATTRLIMAAMSLILITAQPAVALDKKPYDQQLLRLSELLGAVHYLRELCEAGEGPRWRKYMQDLIRTEGSTAARRLLFTRKFNFGYRSYSRTYRNCTRSAQTAIERFVNEAAVIADTMARSYR